ncbi:MAG: PDDEXK nuclease domain-containing protein [Gemmatimonadota bacterium]|nr:PDDEXK nuclease domain-containing protein [Gemmatimonadota bacterium]
MSQVFDFDNLVELCRRTHEETQRSAARAIDHSLVARNWLFGRYIVEYEQHGADRAEYGSQLLAKIASRLQRIGIKGSSVTRLKLYRRFYQKQKEIGPTVSDQLASLASVDGTPAIRPTASDESIPLENTIVLLKDRFSLGWSHYVTLLTIDNPEERRFYELEAAGNGWSVRELERQINSSLYERLALSRDKEEVRRLASEGQVVEKASDLIKNPLVLEFLGLEEKPGYSESELETAIIDRLQHFLLELGKGFLFEARQKRFTFDNNHFRVDLVFYNRLLRCYVLIDLKRGELTHQDLGQMQMYVNYFDRYVKTDDELPTIGIVLCGRKNDAVVELTLPEEANIYASKYQLYLPSKQELVAQLESIQRELNYREGEDGE